MSEQYVTWPLEKIPVGEPLPGSVYLYIDFRFLTFRAGGDIIHRHVFDRLQFKKVQQLFIHESEKKKFEEWEKKKGVTSDTKAQESLNELPYLNKAREDTHRKMLDIFQSAHPDKAVTAAIGSSKKMVMEIMKIPYAIHNLAQLQMYSRGTVDHSVNVSILSAYLAQQMGYTHQLILQHICLGGLLHDIGKTQVPIADNDKPEDIEKKMVDHPAMGGKLLEQQGKVPREVVMIVEQHHEHFDGSGYPKKIRRHEIYDLARLVAICNKFDELVSDSTGSLKDRQREAINKLDQVHYKQFDPQKLEKVLKLLKLGI